MLYFHGVTGNVSVSPPCLMMNLRFSRMPSMPRNESSHASEAGCSGSIVRKIIADNNLSLNTRFDEFGDKSLGEVLLTPTKIYVRPVLEVIKNTEVHGICHITGGGFDENIPRTLKAGQGFSIEEGTWDILPIFRKLEEWGNIPHREMYNIFNMGIGMIIVADEQQSSQIIKILADNGQPSQVIGRVIEGENEIIMK